MKFVSWLEVDGTEVANVNRTLVYLEALGDPRITADADACDCDSVDTGPFSSPQSDPAPWYDGTEASQNFFGFLLDLRMDPPYVRESTPLVAGGASIGRRYRKPRLLQAQGWMFAGSATGMDFGERWLEGVLAGESEGCADDTLRILRSCPGTARTLSRVGLVSGPDFSPLGNVEECTIQEVAFQFSVGNPNVTFDQTVVLNQQQLSGHKSICFAAKQHTAVILTIVAGTADVTGVNVFFEPCPGYSDPYPTYDEYDKNVVGSQTYAEFTVSDIPAGSTLTVDAAQRTVRVEDSSGRLIGGFDALTFRGAWRWMDAYNGADAEVHVDATGAAVNGATSVRIETVEVE